MAARVAQVTPEAQALARLQPKDLDWLRAELWNHRNDPGVREIIAQAVEKQNQ